MAGPTLARYLSAMSYDLILWRGGDGLAADEVWDALSESETVPGLDSYSAEEVVAAFRKHADIVVDGDMIRGRGWELAIGPGAPYLQVCCSWAAADHPETVAAIVRAATSLESRVFDPQQGAYVGHSQPRAETAVDHTPLSDRGDIGRLELPLEGAALSSERPNKKERVTSFERSRRWTHPLPAVLGGLERFLLEMPGQGMGRAHSLHPLNWVKSDACFATLGDGALGLELLKARINGTSSDGTRTTLSRLIGISDGEYGVIGTHAYDRFDEDGSRGERWSNVVLERTGPAASASRRAKNPPTDVSAAILRAGEAALAAAHRGAHTSLRAFLVTAAALVNGGYGVVELLESEKPADDEWIGTSRAWPTYAVFEAGAVMPVWCQRAFAAFLCEVRFALPSDQRFVISLVDHAKTSLTFDVPAPFGPDV